jgi:cytochrome d ubiquinol oxidase subunit II
VIWGWAVAQHPYVLPPSLTISGGAAPRTTLETPLGVFGVAVLLVVPAIALLLTLVQRDLVQESAQPARPKSADTAA